MWGKPGTKEKALHDSAHMRDPEQENSYRKKVE